MFKDRLKFLRDDKNLTQQNLADYLKVARSTISSWELGTTEPDLSLLVKIADYFNVSTDFLLGRSSQAYDENLDNYLKESTKLYFQFIKH